MGQTTPGKACPVGGDEIIGEQEEEVQESVSMFKFRDGQAR
jgi:hypothetical protein